MSSGYNNPYSSPQGFEPMMPSQQPTGRVADLGKRFLGALVDGFAGFLFVGPGYIMMIAATGLDPENRPRGEELPAGALAGLLLLVLGGMALLAVQVYLLATRSQSIGKFVMKTQICDYNSRQPANFVSTFLLRGFVNGLIGAIPCVGGFYSLADILFVFSEDHRCLHDRIANTIVLDIGD